MVVLGKPNIYHHLWILQEKSDFTWRVYDCEELVGAIHRRFDGLLWKIDKSNNRSGSYIFNGCLVQFNALFKKVAQLHCIVHETMKLLEY